MKEWEEGCYAHHFILYFSSCVLVVQSPLIFLEKIVHHFLHGEVGDKLVLRQLHSGDWVKMADPLHQAD
jgi:hypothetical protein